MQVADTTARAVLLARNLAILHEQLMQRGDQVVEVERT